MQARNRLKKSELNSPPNIFFPNDCQGHSQILTFIKLINKDKKIKFEAC